MYYLTNVQSPLGMLSIASDGENITGLWIERQKYYLGSISEKMEKKDDLPVFHNVREWLRAYFAGEKPEISKLPLRPAGSNFRQDIWQILCEIPYGEVVTYGSIAKKVAEKMGRDRMSSQAVGGAVGHNPISIIIPCHRVVGTSGSLTGYAGGIQLKIKLLEHEGVDMTHLFIPEKGTAL